MKLLDTNDIASDDWVANQNKETDCHICGEDATWPHLYLVHNLFEETTFGAWVQKQRVLR